MPIFDIDLTSAGGPPDGVHIANINKVEYQVLTGEKWNKDGTTTVSGEEAKGYPADKRRLHITLALVGHGNVWHDLYFKETALGFMASFFKAAGVPLKNPNPDDLLGKQVLVTLATIEQPGYEARQQITKVSKA